MPRSEPSSASTAQPRPLTSSPSSSPCQLNATPARPSYSPGGHLPPDSDETELAGPVVAELVEPGDTKSIAF
jgi:hypothetical protein